MFLSLVAKLHRLAGKRNCKHHSLFLVNRYLFAKVIDWTKREDACISYVSVPYVQLLFVLCAAGSLCVLLACALCGWLCVICADGCICPCNRPEGGILLLCSVSHGVVKGVSWC